MASGSSIVIDFEISGDPSDFRSADQLFAEIEKNFANAGSALRNGEFSFLADHATIEKMETSAPAQTVFASRDTSAAAQTPITTLSRDTSAPAQQAALQGELQAAIQDASEARAKSVQAAAQAADFKEKMEYAKEMWLKESARAAKLRDKLNIAEFSLADKEKDISNLRQKLQSAEIETENLRKLVERFGAETARPLQNSSKVSNFQVSNFQQSKVSLPTMSQLGGFERSSFGTPAAAQRESPAAELFKNACIAADAIIYEDDVLQIGVKSNYPGLGEGKVNVYFGNKSAGALQNFRVNFAAPDGVALQSAPLPSSRLGPKQQNCISLSVQVIKAFPGSVSASVQFLLPDNSPRSLQFRLPVLLSKFMQGRDLTVDQFFSNWRSQRFQLNEAAAVVNCGESAARATRGASLGGALKLNPQVDESPDNLVLQGKFPADSADGLRCATIPEALVLVRVELGTGLHAGKARLAVRSDDEVVAEAVKNILVDQLTEGILN